MSLPLLSLCACLGCQYGVKNLDSTPYTRQIEDAEGLLFETDRRFIVVQLVESPIEDIVDDDTVTAFISLPWYRGRGLQLRDPGIGVGWMGAALVWSDMFQEKVPLASLLRDYDEGELVVETDVQQFLELAIEQRQTEHYQVPITLELGSRLQIMNDPQARRKLTGPGTNASTVQE